MTFDPTKALAKLGVAVARPMTDLERANARSLRVSGKAAEEAKAVVAKREQAKREQAKQTLHEQYMANSTEYRRAYNTAIHAGALDINARARAVEAMRERDHAEKMATNPTYAERYNAHIAKGKTEKEARLVAMTYIRRLSKVEAGMCSNCCCRPKRDGLATCQRCADKSAAKHLRKYGKGVAYRGTATITTDTGLQFTIEYTATCKQGIAKSLSKAICAVMERAEQ